MKLADLPTPSLVLDRSILMRNINRMAQALARHQVALRPHLKTAKSIEVARLVLAGQPGGITVSTLAEVEYFAGHGISDILYAVGITSAKLAQAAKLSDAGAAVAVITDDVATAGAIARFNGRLRALIEIDTGDGRGGLDCESAALLQLADRLGPILAGVMTHAGQSYAARLPAEITRIAEAERAGVVRAAERLRDAGHLVPVVSMGSSPTALHAATLHGITEIRAGVYMFGDLFQAQLATHDMADIAVTVLASVIGRRPAQHRVLLDAGAIALSKDRSTEAAAKDFGFGLMLDLAGAPAYGDAILRRAYQEHAVVEGAAIPDLPVGAKVRVAPNHACLTCAAHDRYYVIDGGDEVVAVWPRVNGW